MKIAFYLFSDFGCWESFEAHKMNKVNSKSGVANPNWSLGRIGKKF
jgi:hypothetical protein